MISTSLAKIGKHQRWILKKGVRRFATPPQCASVVADACDRHILSSPYPPIPEGPYQPLKEFVSKRWSEWADRVAIIDGSTGMQRTFGEYECITASVAAALVQDFNIDQDSTVALFAPNHVDYLPITLAVSLTGAKLTPINPLYTDKELAVVLQRSRSSVIFVHEACLETALNATKDCPLIQRVVVITDDNHHNIPEGTASLESLKACSSTITQTTPSVHSKTATHSFLLPYSSGTTGLPKGVCLTHQNLVANLLQCEVVEGKGFAPSHTLISPLPLFHIYAFEASLLYCAYLGHRLITMSGRFDLERFCELVQEHKPERAHLVPPIVLGLAKSPLTDQYDLTSLQHIVSAAAPLSEDVEQMAMKRLPQVRIKQAWGMSELSPIGTFSPDAKSKTGSVGPLAPNTFAKVIDPNGATLPPHTDGELLIKGPQVMLGYLDDVEKTAECLSESGWLRTGDICHYDEEGYVYITDRLKELIKVRGYQVAPAELEALLLTHEAINDVAVIQVPSEESGELPRAYVVLDPAASVTAKDIQDWVKERVAPYKRLEGGVIFTDVIPKSASGKILRRILRDQVEGKYDN